MEFYFGPEWQEVPMSDATKAYVNRIHEVSKIDPALLIAHHYTRYLGDLSGGQILRKMATKAMDLPSTGEGVKFYVFENIPNAKSFKNIYRSCLDELCISKAKSDAIVREANNVFQLNIHLFQEIDSLAGFEDTSARLKKKPVEAIPNALDSAAKESSGACPFATMAKKPMQASTSDSKEESKGVNPVFLTVFIAVAAILVGLILARMS